ncbi:copper amine oxidase N-terminal domain-containing protein [Heliorestis acidaminivorans]|uniref:Copper amine oxidase N-terminal domain-containing protein n=1 Tax=Heliorestis acidaminivorans TaxID=553427 RepID=A0A6I0F1I3_9FIRM|nr:copper amine oxidase N-terminal domain-containing protein [Heliorestis acidaminivorans]KAB2953791.1 copper amine oxidase N-terminal domain-containing protein [Heliorestis acidaminivorans]
MNTDKAVKAQVASTSASFKKQGFKHGIMALSVAILFMLSAIFLPMGILTAEASPQGYKMEWVHGIGSETEMQQIHDTVEAYIRNNSTLRGYAGMTMLGYGGYRDRIEEGEDEKDMAKRRDSNRALYGVHFISGVNTTEPLQVSSLESSQGRVSFGEITPGYRIVHSTIFQLRKEGFPETRWVVESTYPNQPSFFRIGFLTNEYVADRVNYATLIDPRQNRSAKIAEPVAGFEANIPHFSVDRIISLRLNRLDMNELVTRGNREAIPVAGVRLVTNRDPRYSSSSPFTRPITISFQAPKGMAEPTIGYWDEKEKSWIPLVGEIVEKNNQRYIESEVKVIGDFALFPNLFADPVKEPGKKPSVFESFEQIRSVTLNGRSINFEGDAKPYLEDNRVMVPLRPIAEALGATVRWTDEERKVEIYRGGHQIGFWIGQKRVITNGPMIEVDVPARVIEDHTVVPLRFLAQALDINVTWDPLNKIVDVRPRNR